MPRPDYVLIASRDRRSELLNAILRDFLRTPRLALTRAQVGRLYTIESSTCDQLLQCLSDEGLLDCRTDGRFVLRTTGETGDTQTIGEDRAVAV